MTYQQDWVYWLRLMQTTGVGTETARKLLSYFGPPPSIFDASYIALSKVVSERVARALQSEPEGFAVLQSKTEVWLSEPHNYVIVLGDEHYPKRLLEIPDPPIMLYVKGRFDLLNQPCIAIVGSRQASSQGLLNAERFAENLSQSSVAISSGLASGIDAAAHIGGMRGTGSTIAVIGTGADIVYPARNRKLAHEIANQGCIVSEYPLGTPAIASNFPRRNRIISGLAHGVLVVEAAIQSGSLVTARTAIEQGREVFSIPGSIHSPLSKGCHLLIKQGAKLVESAQDILDELPLMLSHPSAPLASSARHLSDTEDAAEVILDKKINKKIPEKHSMGETAQEHPLLCWIGFDPVSIDDLQAQSAYPIAELNSELLSLELEGMIEVRPGGKVQRLA